MEPERASQVVVAAGVNVAPGSADDGWVAPRPVKLADGTLVQLFKDGQALRAAYEAIESAKRRICLEVYIFASDKTGCAFAELLGKKAREGLNVHVIYDSFGSMNTDREMFRRMQADGVKLYQFNPIRPWECEFSWRPVNRDHRKLLVIDDGLAGLGGLNVGREYAGSWVIRDRDEKESDFWRDNAVGFQGPGARQLLKAFARSFHYVTRGGPLRRAEFEYNIDALDHPSGDGQMSILASVPTRNSALRPVLHRLFRNATRSIQMTMAYFAPDDLLIDALCRAAKRGVRVELMLPSICDINALIVAARSFYETLMSAGVQIYERQTVVLHAKTMTIDGQTTVLGSANLDYRSIEYNLELSAIIRSEEFGRHMAALFRNDVRFAHQINLKEWRRRPMYDRCVQWAVNRARYLL